MFSSSSSSPASGTILSRIMAALQHQLDTSSRIDRMPIVEEEEQHLCNTLPLVDSVEAERLIEGLVKFAIEDVGNSAWMEQHRVIEKLNIQAHQNASSNSDEYVLEAFLVFKKLSVLLHDLVVIENWKQYVYPRIFDHVAGRNNMRIYFILYHEATIINLLEVFFYHKHLLVACGDEVIDVIDYVSRKLIRLNSGYDFRSCYETSSSGSKESTASAAELAASIEFRSPSEELHQHFADIEFRVCISSCFLARYIAEHADDLPLSALSRIADTHDFLILIVPLIENPPWTRRTDKGRWQKIVDHKWVNIPPIDLLKVTKLEGQAWIAIYHLVAKKVFQERYHLNSFRKGQLLRVRKYINEILLDQLPFLADIQRYMDELAIMEVPEPQGLRSNSFLMFQQVAVIRDRLTKGRDWEILAQRQINQVFTMTDKNDTDLAKIADVYTDDLAEDIFEPHK